MLRSEIGASESRRREARRGFALVTVIWGLAIIALLIVSYQSTARLRLQMAFNLAGAARAELIADAAVNAAVLSLLSERDMRGAPGERPLHNGEPVFCALEGAAVAIALEDESGKVDLNAASPKLLQAMLEGFSVDAREAETIARSIIAFRSAPTGAPNPSNAETAQSERPFGLKRALYQSIFELDQTPGVSPSLFQLVSPFVTVHSRSPGVDAGSAPPALFAALSGLSPAEVLGYVATPFPNSLDRKQRANNPFFSQLAESGAILAHVEAMLPTGQTGVREVLLDFRSAAGEGYAVKELRRGQTRHLSRLRASVKSDDGSLLPSC